MISDETISSTTAAAGPESDSGAAAAAAAAAMPSRLATSEPANELKHQYDDDDHTDTTVSKYRDDHNHVFNGHSDWTHGSDSDLDLDLVQLQQRLPLQKEPDEVLAAAAVVTACDSVDLGGYNLTEEEFQALVSLKHDHDVLETEMENLRQDHETLQIQEERRSKAYKSAKRDWSHETTRYVIDTVIL
jgi:hypothetical protein